MTVPPEAAVTAAAVAIHDADCPDTKCSGAALGHATRLARVALEAAAPHIREQIASRMEVLAANYPADVFSPEGTSRDAISGAAMRHAYRNAARDIRERGDGR